MYQNRHKQIQNVGRLLILLKLCTVLCGFLDQNFRTVLRINVARYFHSFIDFHNTQREKFYQKRIWQMNDEQETEIWTNIQNVGQHFCPAEQLCSCTALHILEPQDNENGILTKCKPYIFFCNEWNFAFLQFGNYNILIMISVVLNMVITINF